MGTYEICSRYNKLTINNISSEIETRCKKEKFRYSQHMLGLNHFVNIFCYCYLQMLCSSSSLFLMAKPS